MVRGKFRLQSITSNASYTGQQFVFTAVSNDATPENERFHKFTPSGEFVQPFAFELPIESPAPPAE